MRQKNIDMSTLTLEEIDQLLNQAKDEKKRRVTPAPVVLSILESVTKHTETLLSLVHKMDMAEGVSLQRRQQLENQLARLQMPRIFEEAKRTPIKERKQQQRHEAAA